MITPIAVLKRLLNAMEVVDLSEDFVTVRISDLETVVGEVIGEPFVLTRSKQFDPEEFTPQEWNALVRLHKARMRCGQSPILYTLRSQEAAP